MTIEAKIIADSISAEGNRLTTLQLRMHRFILPEFNTHRAFSRNTRSERAVPVKKLIEEVRNSPAMPIHWGKNQPGMQAHEELTAIRITSAKDFWRSAAWQAADYAEELANLGLHKQIANRVLSPFTWAHTLVTATEFSNFFALRRHEDAQPEIRALADAMHDAMQASKPENLKPGQWHLPYVLNSERNDYTLETCIKLSVARCARVSYEPFDGNASVEKELERYELLVGAVPLHASPAEHQGTPDEYCAQFGWDHQEDHGNFRGWRQFRKMLPGECQ